jgi:outer membrane protein
MEGDSMPLKRMAGSALLFVCGTILPVFAQTQAPKPAPKAVDSPAKIAVVQFQPAVTATNEFQRDFGELQKKFEPKRTELKNLGDEIDRLTNELQTGAAKLSEAEQGTRARTIESKKKQAQRLAEDDQNEYEQAVQEAFNRVGAKVGDELTRYATEHGYTLVVDRSERQDQTPVVLWANPSIDITQPVVEAYNAKSGVPAPAAPAAPAAPKPASPR